MRIAVGTALVVLAIATALPARGQAVSTIITQADAFVVGGVGLLATTLDESGRHCPGQNCAGQNCLGQYCPGQRGLGRCGATRQSPVRYCPLAMGQSSSTTVLELTADGCWLASAGGNSIQLRNACTGSLLRTLRIDETDVRCIVFCNSPWLASGSEDQTIRIWNYRTGRLVATLSGHQDAVNCLFFSQSAQRLISGSDDGTLRFWNLPKRTCTNLITTGSRRVVCGDCARDGRWMATGDESGRVTVRSVATSAVVATTRRAGQEIHAVRFSPSGKQVFLGGSQRELTAWHWQKSAPPQALLSTADEISAIDCDTTGRVVVGCYDGSIYCNDCENAAQNTNGFVRLPRHTGPVNSVAMVCTDVISVGWDKCIRRTTRLTTSDRWQAFGVNRVAAMARVNGTQRLLVADDLEVKLVEPSSKTVEQTFVGHKRAICALCAISASEFVSADEGGTVLLWHRGNARPFIFKTYAEGAVVTMAAAPRQSCIAIGLRDGSIEVLDPRGRQSSRVYQAHNAEIVGLDWHSAHSPIISCDVCGVVVSSMDESCQTIYSPSIPDAVGCFARVGPHYVAQTTAGGTLRLIELAGGKAWVAPLQIDAPTALAASNSGLTILLGNAHGALVRVPLYSEPAGPKTIDGRANPCIYPAAYQVLRR